MLLLLLLRETSVTTHKKLSVVVSREREKGRERERDSERKKETGSLRQTR